MTKTDESGNAEYTVGKLLLVFFGILVGVFSLGSAAPFLSNVSMARAAAYEVFKIIDRVCYKIWIYLYFNYRISYDLEA